MVNVVDIRDLFSGTRQAISDLIEILDPRTTGKFFTNMRICPMKLSPIVIWVVASFITSAFLSSFIQDATVINAILFAILIFAMWLGNYSTNLLLMSSYFFYLGCYLIGSAQKLDEISAIKLAFSYSLTSVLMLVCIGIIINKLQASLIQRQTSFAEGFSLAVFSFFPTLLSGVFLATQTTFVITLLFLAYCLYIFYKGIKIRFGFENSIKIFILSVFSSGLLGMIIFVTLVTFFGIERWYWGGAFPS
ncbi:MAG TPA: hypothetical protein ENG50_02920 [Candidatus Altiarchaeales archaeon]|nr:hypothetical protein [Candidatus Altiarchaeales archaeon]